MAAGNLLPYAIGAFYSILILHASICGNRYEVSATGGKTSTRHRVFERRNEHIQS